MNEGLHIREKTSYKHNNKKLQQFHNKTNLLIKIKKKKKIEITDYGRPCSRTELENYFGSK